MKWKSTASTSAETRFTRLHTINMQQLLAYRRQFNLKTPRVATLQAGKLDQYLAMLEQEYEKRPLELHLGINFITCTVFAQQDAQGCCICRRYTVGGSLYNCPYCD